MIHDTAKTSNQGLSGSNTFPHDTIDNTVEEQ